MATTITETGGRYPPGTVLSGRYRTVSLIGKGGMGEVYLAEDLVLDEPVALKFLPLDAAAEPELMERFLAEVRLARKVTHPNVARVHDIAEADGRTFLSMEYVDGEDLHQLLRRIGRLPAEKAVEIAKQICEGLHAAHDRGVLHRDLKPANIMLDGNGRVRITDFGLAELAREGTEGRVMGTPAYMSPEQITGGKVTVRSDLYSLGLVLYEIFTGKRAFEGKTLADYQRLQVHESPNHPSTVLEHVDPAVEAVILRCIEKDPAARPSSARAVTLALPGGDPLAAALASGDTPAPELVAAAGSHELAPQRVVSGLFAAWLALIAGLLALAPSDGSRRLERPGERPAAVLEDRIHTLLGELGYRTPPADSGAWFENDERLLEAYKQAAKATAGVDGSAAQQADAHDADSPGEGAPGAEPGEGPGAGTAAESGAEPAATAGAGRSADLPSPLVLRYRQSPRILDPAGGYLSSDDPAHTVPGMVRLTVDATGRLLELDVVPGGPDDPGRDAEQTPVDDTTWDRLFAAAGLQRAEAESVPADFLPSVQTSERHEWTLAPAGGTAWRVTAAGLGGLPVHFAIAPVAEEQPAQEPPTFFTWLQITLLLAGALLAWRNVHGARSDKKGAWRVAVVGFLTHFVLWLGSGNHPGGVVAWHQTLITGLGYDFYIGLQVYVYYLALEPVVRRRWPTALISWQRLLTGRLADPLVGRDVLAGGAAVLGFAVATAGLDRILRAAGMEGTEIQRNVGGLQGSWQALAGAIHAAGDAVMYSLLLMLVLVLLRTAARFPWLAAVLWVALPVVIPAAAGDTLPLYGVVVAAGFMLLFWGLAVRFGMLSCCVMLYVLMLVSGLDLTLDLGSWHVHTTVVTLLVLLALGGWAFRSALAGRPVIAQRG